MKKTTLFLLTGLLFFACNKSTQPEPCTTSPTSVSGSYKITAYTYKASPASVEMDYFAIIMPEACERDDIYTFNANGTYTRADRGAVCALSRNDNGTWSLSGSIMTVDGDQNLIESFDCKTLVLVNTDTNIAGDRLKFTLVRQ